MSHHPHRIVCAAIKLRDGKIICGVRHFDQIMQQTLPHPDTEGAVESVQGHLQGFIDNHYQFVDRKTAWLIAKRANQIQRHRSTIDGTLYSEDLY